MSKAHIKFKNAGTYSQRESVAFTRLVLTSPISPVLSSLPMNHSKQVTSRPLMMMRSPASKLSSSGPLPSYTSVASQIPTADICFINHFSNSVSHYIITLQHASLWGFLTNLKLEITACFSTAYQNPLRTGLQKPPKAKERRKMNESTVCKYLMSTTLPHLLMKWNDRFQ